MTDTENQLARLERRVKELEDRDQAAKIERLESAVARLEDEKAILELMAVYGFAADTPREDQWVGLFTQDGAMDMSFGSVISQYAVPKRWVGAEQLTEFINDPAGHRREGSYGRTLHLQGNNVVLRIDGDTAEANGYSLVVLDDGKTVTITSAGVNRWRFERIDGRWQIAERLRREPGNREFEAVLSGSIAER